MRFVYGAVELCSSCTFTLADLVITNDRKGSGPLYDLFTGEGSRACAGRHVRGTLTRGLHRQQADHTAAGSRRGQC